MKPNISELVTHSYSVSGKHFAITVKYFDEDNDHPYYGIYYRVFESDPFPEKGISVSREDRNELFELLGKADYWLTK
jgi:hypothetical protein